MVNENLLISIFNHRIGAESREEQILEKKLFSVNFSVFIDARCWAQIDGQVIYRYIYDTSIDQSLNKLVGWAGMSDWFGEPN